MSKRLTWALTFCVTIAVMAPMAVRAQMGAGASYITPFPEGDTYQIRVVGDTLAEGLLGAMVNSDTLAREARVNVNRKLWTLS